MTCHELAKCIEKLQPEALPHEVARLCLLLSNCVDDLDKLKDEERLVQVWQDMQVRLEAVTDQHAAMTADLEKLSRTNPEMLTFRSDYGADPSHQGAKSSGATLCGPDLRWKPDL